MLFDDTDDVRALHSKLLQAEVHSGSASACDARRHMTYMLPSCAPAGTRHWPVLID
jgi:hypothetical protein